MTVQEQHTLKALENFCSKANKRLSEIDWEQRRYEIAKEVASGFAANGEYLREMGEHEELCVNDFMEGLANDAIKVTDYLIQALKKR